MSLTEKLREYTQQQKELYLPYLWDKWGIQPQKLSNALVQIWDEFKNPRMYGNLLHLNYKGEEPQYYEVCDTKYKRGETVNGEHIHKYSYYNQKEDQHVSVFKHDKTWKNNYKKTGSVSCRDTLVTPDFIYLELDRPSLKKSIKDARRIYNSFPFKEALNFWYSGNTSIHVEVDARLFGSPIDSQDNVCGVGKLFYNLAHKCAGDCRHENGVEDTWLLPEPELFKEYYETTGEIARSQDLQKIRQSMENIDPNLFRVNSLIRQPWSWHEKGEKQKVKLNYRQLDMNKMQDVRPFIVDIDQKFSYPYLLHWVYECYEPRYQPNRSFNVDVDTDEVIKTFAKAFEYFNPEDTDANGWVNQLYSPFYKDTNPSVSVNVETGHYYDFGNPMHNFNFTEFKEKLNT